MLKMAKQQVRAVVPRPLIERAKHARHAGAVRRARQGLAAAPLEPEWLGDADWDRLSKRYPIWGDPAIFGRQIVKPDDVRAAEVVRAIPDLRGDVLDIGGGRGEIAWSVRRHVESVTVCDPADEVVDGALAAGVRSSAGSATELPFDDDSFDHCYSINAFEHIPDPAAALREAARVTRPGGTIYLSFAPLYHAAYGLHAFFAIGVPFCQHLWSPDQFRARGIEPTTWGLNHLPPSAYHEACDGVADSCEVLSASSQSDYSGLELVQQHPSCFAKVGRDLALFTTSKLVFALRVK